MHDSGVIEDYIKTAPGIEFLNGGLDICLFGDVDFDGLDFADGIRGTFLCFGNGFFQSRLRDVTHEHICPFAEEEDGCLQTDASVM